MSENKNKLVGQIKEVYYRLLDDLGIWIDSCTVRLFGGEKVQIESSEQEAEMQPVKAKNSAAFAAEAPAVSEKDMLTAERQEIADWLKKVKFKTKLFAGADEVDVWKKIAQLNRLYDQALLAERARYEALIDMYKKSACVADAETESDNIEREVEDEYSEEGEQLRSRQDNFEETAESVDEVRVYQPDTEDSGDSADILPDPFTDFFDNSGKGEQHVSGDQGRGSDDRVQVRARVRKK